jgi:predicted ATPase
MIRDSDRLRVGRDEELKELVERLSTAKLLSIVGPPGVGKSLLARAALDAVAGEWLDLDLTDARTDDELRDALARALGSDDETLTKALRRRGGYVLLDGFDRLIPHAVRTLADLAPDGDVHWVVTSRQRLSLPDTTVVSIGPMDREDALDLFATRAEDVVPDFDLAEVRETTEQLVDRLDRNPLAIELATARLRTFSPADLMRRLDRRFDLLRGRPARRSLADALQLSWDLLDESERECLRQCAVFREGFDLDAAEAVVDLGDDAPWTLDVVESLVDRSLLSRADASGAAGRGRLGMSESIRDFVDVQRSDPVDEQIETRHADYYLRRGAQWRATPWTADALEGAAAEVANLVAVVDRFADTDPERTCSAALSLDAVFRYRPDTALHQRVLERGAWAARTAGDEAALAELLAARAELGVVMGQLEQAADDAAEAAGLAMGSASWKTFIRCEVLHGEVERRTGHARAALDRLDALDETLEKVGAATKRYVLAHRAACHAELGQLSEARDIAMHLPPPTPDADAAMEYDALKRLAYAHYYLGNYEHQHRLNRDALELARHVGDRRRAARARQGLGDAAFARGDFHEVRDHYTAALEVHRELGNEHLEGVLLGNLGSAEHRIGEFDDAARHYEESLAIHQRTGARPYEAVVTFALATLEHERGHLDDAAFRYERAAELFGELRQPDDVVATQVCRSWLEMLRDDADAAERHLDWAEVSAPRAWLPVVEGSRRLLAVRRGDAADPVDVTSDEDSLPALLANGLASLVATAGKSIGPHDRLSNSLQGRLLLEFASENEPPSPTSLPETTNDDAQLVIGEEGEWFRVVGEESVNLRRRRAHRLILDRLMEIYESTPGTPLDVYDAFDIGWPGESATAETAAERVYWVVGTLRKLGLDGMLLTSDAGYYLDPGARVERGSDPQKE